MIDQKQLDAGNEIRALNYGEIAEVAGGAVKCTITRVVLNIGWLQVGLVDCGGTQGVLVSNGQGEGSVTIP